MSSGSESSGPNTEWLTIGDLQARTGVRPTTLRMWESRYGFPRPDRLESGHRRYRAEEAALILQVLRLRDDGIRLEAAIERTLREHTLAGRSPSASIYAELRRRHPTLVPHRLRKTTLRGLSWAIEDEVRASAASGYLFGAFQEQRFYEAARPRWLELAAFARATFVFAAFDAPEVEDHLTSVPIGSEAPLRREWAVVCDAPDFAVALSAWELPRQGDVRDRYRQFESLWTIDPAAVRDAARVCARVAQRSAAPGSEEAARELSSERTPAPVDPVVTALFNRMVAYIDREHP